MTSISEKSGVDRKETWSNLPVLLLWMIKDRLPFMENLMVSVVCKHWHYASKIDPKKELQGAEARSMWLMRINYECWRGGQITNFSTGKKYLVGSPYVDSVNATATMVICSEKGWLLLATPLYQIPEKKHGPIPSSPIFLFNPFTKQRYDLPIATSEQNKLFEFFEGAISIVNGIPQWVAIGVLDGPFTGNSDLDPLQYILKIAQPNGKEWRTYTYLYGREENYSMDCMARMLIRNNHVYLIDRFGRTLAFYIFGAMWTSIVKQRGKPNIRRDPIIQSDDVSIIRIVLEWDSVRDPKQITRFLFQKLNEDEGRWVNLDHNELIGKWWYIIGSHHFFVSKDAGKTEVYNLQGLCLETYTVNMVAGGSAQLVSRHQVDRGDGWTGMIWVDLG